MPTTIVVPQLGESVVEGTIGKWLKKVGDPIAKDEPIVEIITDKINIELPAPAAGTLGSVLIAEGVVAQVGQELGVILAQGESLVGGPAAPSAPAAAPATGGAESASESVEPAMHAPPPSAATAAPPAAVPGGPPTDGDQLSPAVRKLVKEHGVDLRQIRGSGLGGRVTRDDVLAYLDRMRLAPGAPAPPAARAGAPPPAPPMPSGAPAAAVAPPTAPALRPIPAPALAGEASREEVVETATVVRKKIAENMLRARHMAAHCAVSDEVDMTELVEMRGRLKEKVRAEYGVKLTYTPFIVKAVVRALKEHPVLNASMIENEIHYKKYYNIGIAAHREAGLIVPVVHAADRKSLLQLASEIEDLGTRARTEKLTLDDIQGGTFTITNAGMFGATSSVPVINYPEVGILGVHLVEERAVVREHRIVVRWMMTLTLSFDHRLVDGTPAVKFLHRVKELLEDPESWLLEAV